jgi:hypothetical protein
MNMKTSRIGIHCVTSVALATAALGCGNAATTTDEGGLASQTENLAAAYWRGWGIGPAAPTPIDSNPAACTNMAGFTHVFVRDSNQRYRGHTIAGLDGMLSGGWSGQIGTQQFWSSPACTALYPAYTAGSASNSTLLLAGKGLDNRVYVQLLTGDTHAEYPNDLATPPAQTAWGQLSSTQYVGGSNGFPAVAANGTSRLVLTLRNDNSIIAYNRALPFSGFSPWSGAQYAPALPSGVTATGVPAITYVGANTNAFVVVVKSTTPKVISWITYNGTAWVGGWTKVTLPHTLTSDPTLEWTNVPGSFVGLTLYFRDETNQVVQTSVTGPSGFGSGSYDYIPTGSSNPTPPTILGSPSAVTGGGLETGLRMVLVRGYMPETPTAERSAGILEAEDKCGQGCPSP